MFFKQTVVKWQSHDTSYYEMVITLNRLLYVITIMDYNNYDTHNGYSPYTIVGNNL